MNIQKQNRFINQSSKQLKELTKHYTELNSIISGTELKIDANNRTLNYIDNREDWKYTRALRDNEELKLNLFELECRAKQAKNSIKEILLSMKIQLLT